MKLLSLEVSNVLGAPDGRYAFEVSDGVPCSLALISGHSASGKTSLIEAIVAAKEAVGSYGQPPRPAHIIRRGSNVATLNARWLLSPREHHRLLKAPQLPQGERPNHDDGSGDSSHDSTTPEPESLVVTTRVRAEKAAWQVEAEPVAANLLDRLFARYSMSADDGKVEYFPARRHIHPELWRPHPGDLDQLREASLRVTKDVSKYGFVRTWLFDLVVAEGMRMQEILATKGLLVPSEDLDLLAPFKHALASLSETIRLQRVDAGRAGATHVWFARRGGAQVELAELSDSETQAVIFAATFARHGLDHSLVLIDTPELSIAPRRQRPFLESIAALGSDDQVIVATSSPSILNELEAHKVPLS